MQSAAGRDWDAIVIGSGVGGLTTAAFLQTNGQRTLVLEQGATAGGYSQVFRRKRAYEFDAGLHYIGDCDAETGLFPQTFRALGCEGKLEFLEMDPDGFDRLVFPTFRLDVPRGWETFAARVVDLFPAEERAIRKCLGILRRVGEQLFTTMPGHPRALLRAPLRGPTLLRWGMRSVTALFDSCGLSPDARAAIAGQSPLYATPPSRCAVMMLALTLEHYVGRGAYYPKGGGQMFPALLVNVIQTHGGMVRTQARVEKILLRKGRVEGVRLVDGETITAPVVVSGTDIRTTYLDLVGEEHVSRRLVRRVKRNRDTPATFSVYLGLDIDLKDRIPNQNLWWNPKIDQDELYREFSMTLPEDPCYLMVSGSRKDPGNTHMAPPGHSCAEVITYVPHDPRVWNLDSAPRRYSKAPGYRSVKEMFADRVIDTVARTTPELADITDHIVWKEASTPMTLERYTLTHAPLGIEMSTDQMGLRRSFVTTPIKGLYITGTDTVYCHGIMGTTLAGIGAAGAILGRPDLLREIQGGAIFGSPEKITAGGEDWDPLLACRRLAKKPRASERREEARV